MRAKYLKEDINPLFKPKSKEEIDSLFKQEFKNKTGYSYEEAEQIVNELIDLGVDCYILTKLTNKILRRPIEISPYEIVISNDNATEVLCRCANEISANNVVNVLNNNIIFRFENKCTSRKTTSIYGDSFTVKEALQILEKLKAL